MLELGFTLFWALRGWGISSKNVNCHPGSSVCSLRASKKSSLWKKEA